MKIKIGNTKDVRGRGESTQFLFNLGLSTPDISIVSPGWRVVKNKIYPPSQKKKNMWSPVLYLGGPVIQELYEKLGETLPSDLQLEPVEIACKSLMINDKTVETYLK